MNKIWIGRLDRELFTNYCKLNHYVISDEIIQKSCEVIGSYVVRH